MSGIVLVKVALAIATAIALPLRVGAQTIVDGSAANGDQREIKAVVAMVADNLRDPMSALFRNIRKVPQGAWCGQYNAKSIYGGYVGFRPFIVGLGATPSILFPTANEGQLAPSAPAIAMSKGGCVD